MQILNFLRFNISLQVKVMASEAAMTFTADSKADRKSAENTTFQHRPCAYFRRSPHWTIVNNLDTKRRKEKRLK